MSVTPGSASNVNKIAGIASIKILTAADVTTLTEKILPAGLILALPNGKIVLTDGASALGALEPTIDQVLTETEKTALENAFGTGAYVAAANGVVSHGADGKIADSSLNLVADGKLVQTYLADFVENGMIKASVLPNEALATRTYFANYAALASATDIQKLGLAVVVDASGDSTVDAGMAVYTWNDSESKWDKIHENESMDVDYSSIECNYVNCEAAGCVMYDHPVVFETLTAEQLATLDISAD